MAKSLPQKKSSKSEKVKISKEQKIRVNKMIRIENRIATCRDYIRLWAQLFRFFVELNRDQPVTPEQEKQFFQVTTAIARKHFLFCELMADAFHSSDKIMEVLTSAVSLERVRQMDEPTFNKLQLEWHSLFIEMNVTLGRLLRQMPQKDKNLNELLQIAEQTAASQRVASNGVGGVEGAANEEKKRGGLVKKKG